VSKKKVPAKADLEERVRRLEGDVTQMASVVHSLVALQERVLQLEEKRQSSWWRW
jgi:hypothetical protein